MNPTKSNHEQLFQVFRVKNLQCVSFLLNTISIVFFFYLSINKNRIIRTRRLQSNPQCDFNIAKNVTCKRKWRKGACMFTDVHIITILAQQIVIYSIDALSLTFFEVCVLQCSRQTHLVWMACQRYSTIIATNSRFSLNGEHYLQLEIVAGLFELRRSHK